MITVRATSHLGMLQAQVPSRAPRHEPIPELLPGLLQLSTLDSQPAEPPHATWSSGVCAEQNLDTLLCHLQH